MPAGSASRVGPYPANELMESDQTSATLSIRIELLGAFQVEVNGVPIKDYLWTRLQSKTLVKILALQPQHQLTQLQLVELLWPNPRDQKGAQQKLHRVIYDARRALEPEREKGARSVALQVRGQRIILRPDSLWIDVEEFRQKATAAMKSSELELYEEALALYRGDLLPEDLCEEWTISYRERLRDYYRDLLVRAARLSERLKDYHHSIGYLRRLVEHEPADEETHRRLMRLYALTGNKTQALEQYERCRTAVRKYLDTSPDDETRQLGRQILLNQLQPLPEFRHDASGAAEPSTYIPGQGAAGGNLKAKHSYTLAVLPLSNRSSHPESEYLTGALTESLIQKVSALTGARVTPHSSVMPFKGDEANRRNRWHELKVDVVLSSAFYAEADRAIIKTELVEVRDGSRLWEAEYTVSLAEVLAAQDEIAGDVAEQLEGLGAEKNLIEFPSVNTGRSRA